MSSRTFKSPQFWIPVVCLLQTSHLTTASISEFDLGYGGLFPSDVYCTSQFGCSSLLLGSSYQVTFPKVSFSHFEKSTFRSDWDEEETCTSKSEAEDASVGELLKHRCSSSHHFKEVALHAHPNNCTLFFKCNWGAAVTFECPQDLHFNADLQVCDWPWQANCDSSWATCPRPSLPCPPQHSSPLYLPHPRLCDHFYQCNWGQSHLQTCPAGLHFNPKLNICDWPHKANCHVC